MSQSYDYNERAARGQAYNLAVLHALRDHSEMKDKEIYSLSIRYYELGKAFQESNIDELKALLKCE